MELCGMIWIVQHSTAIRGAATRDAACQIDAIWFNHLTNTISRGASYSLGALYMLQFYAALYSVVHSTCHSLYDLRYMTRTCHVVHDMWYTMCDTQCVVHNV